MDRVMDRVGKKREVFICGRTQPNIVMTYRKYYEK